jgi:Arc/MetJ-type ribon-helix-helix transcriptional regulator
MRLLNVRLDDNDARLVRSLKDRGVSISDVVRKAIRAEAGRDAARGSIQPEALLAEMRERYPSPEGETVRPRVDSTDRRQVGRFIRAKLRKRP